MNEKIVKIPKRIPWKSYEDLNSKTFEAEPLSNNKEINKLVHSTFKSEFKNTFYSFSNPTKFLSEKHLEHFINEEITSFLHNESTELFIKIPSKLSSAKKLDQSILEKKYGIFCLKKDLVSFSKNEINWRTLSKKINENIDLKTKNMINIFRKSFSLKKDTGEWRLSVAWPFIKGKTKTKVVRTPLMWMPLRILKTPSGYKLEKFKSNYKINSEFIKLIHLEQGKIPHKYKTEFSNVNDLFKEYIRHGVKISGSLIKKGTPSVISQHEMEEYKSDSFTLENIFVVENKKDSDYIFNDLLKIFNSHKKIEEPIMNRSFLQHKTTKKNERFPMKKIDANKSDVIRIALNNSMVIWGPPGTGKSETLTALIAKAACENKTTLLVAEKTTALNVVETRLESRYSLGKFSLRLAGEGLSKKTFYNKVIELDAALNEFEGEMSDLDLSSEYVYFLENYWKVMKFLNNKNISMERFWKNHKIIEEICEKFKHLGNKPSEIIFLIKESLRNKTFLSSRIREIENILSGVHDSKIIESKEELLQKFDFKMVPPIVYRSRNMISWKTVVNLSEEPEELFKYLSNGQYGRIKSKRLFKRYRNELNKIISIAHEINDFRKHGKKSTSMYKTREEYEEELKECKNKKTHIIDMLSKNIGIDYSEKIEKMTEEEVDNVRYVSRVILNNDMEKLINLQNTYEEFVKEKERVYDIAKNSYQYSIVRNIKREFKLNKELLDKYNALVGMANYSENKRMNPKLIIKNNFELLKLMFPIIIATPNEVSHLVPIESNQFNYGIFDEASQMLLQNALPSIHRVENVVISGDHKQLLPTDFFQKKSENIIEHTGELNHSKISYEADSLLTWGKTRYITKMLTSHYRSNHSKLIEYSNNKYYNSKLLVGTSPNAEDIPLEMFNVEGKWIDNTNKAEIKKIIEILKGYIKEKRFSTYGIIAFNRKQADLITETILKDEKLSKWFCHEEEYDLNSKDKKDIQIFVKNIERVQGEEAECIIFSVGYSYNEEDKFKVGALMHISDNRLNVAITRSSKKMIVIKSVKSSEFMAKNKNTGKYKMYHWLEWYEKNANKVCGSYDIKENEKISHSKNLFLNDVVATINKNFGKKYKVVIKEGGVLDLAIYDKKTNIPMIGLVLMNEQKEQEIIKMCELEEIMENIGWNIFRVSPFGYYRKEKYLVDSLIKEYKLIKNSKKKNT